MHRRLLHRSEWELFGLVDARDHAYLGDGPLGLQPRRQPFSRRAAHQSGERVVLFDLVVFRRCR